MTISLLALLKTFFKITTVFQSFKNMWVKAVCCPCLEPELLLSMKVFRSRWSYLLRPLPALTWNFTVDSCTSHIKYEATYVVFAFQKKFMEFRKQNLCPYLTSVQTQDAKSLIYLSLVRNFLCFKMLLGIMQMPWSSKCTLKPQNIDVEIILNGLYKMQ